MYTDVQMEDESQELKERNENVQNSVSKTTYYSQELLNVVINNRKDEIESIIKHSKEDILNFRFEDYENKCIILIACINKQVTKDTLNILCECIRSKYHNIDCFDEDWYKWEPLHHVARIGDPEKLQVLLDNNVDVNSLTTFSENALHVLLNYEQHMKPFNSLFYNGIESEECVIINTEKDSSYQCAKKLINAGIDINQNNIWNETPICIAARYRSIQIIQLLLSIPTIDLDNYEEGGLTIRAYLKDNYICEDSLSQSNILYENPVKILFTYLKSGDEESFLKFNNENIKDYANSIDGDIESNSSGNMLQVCFKKGFLEYLQHDLYDEELTKPSITNNLMLKVFYSSGLGRCIMHLLNNGADRKKTYRKFPQPLLEAAAVVGYYPLVAILLQHKDSQVTTDEIFNILPKLYQDNKTNFKNYGIYRKYVLNLLLNKLVNLKGDEILSSGNLDILNNILQHLNLKCDEEGEDDSDSICQILKLGVSLTRKVEGKKIIIQDIHPDILKLHFDDCIENNLFLYNSIIEDNDKNYSEIKALYFLANDCSKKELLQHPLLIYFIHNKWLQNLYFFYMDLLLYFIFLLSIYIFMVSSQRNNFNTILNILFFSLLGTHIIEESIQLAFYQTKYFLDIINYLELTVIICSLISIFNYNEYSAVIAILFSTVIFVMLLGQVPICAKYTIIFGSTKYFLQYAGFYFIQFVSFALVFYLIFPIEGDINNVSNSNSTIESSSEGLNDIVGNIFKSLFYTLIFFTGEFNDRVLEPDRFPVFGRIVMATFVLCMTIILNNLLVGMIVADITEMKRVGKLYKQIKVANFIARINSVVKYLYELKTYKFIKTVIDFLHVFKEGENKVLDVNKCKHSNVFDDEDVKYLKSIRYSRNKAYNPDLLKSLYIVIQDKLRTTNKKNHK